MKLQTQKDERVKFTRAQGAVLVAIIFAALLLLVTTGCTNKTKMENNQQPPISSKPMEQQETVKLYFADAQAMYLKPEVRQVTVQGELLADVVVKELIKGPEEKGLQATIPGETKLISLKIADGVAYVNLSKEIQAKHWGGSTGEIMTVYSIVNTLADLNIGIEKVQLLVEGEKQQTLVGHLDTYDPLTPMWNITRTGEILLGKVPLNNDKLKEIQASVDNGNQQWYLTPIQVAMETGTRYGFDPREDEFILQKQQHAHTVYVQVTRDNQQYSIELIQPVKQGQDGIWVINAINKVNP